MLHGNPTWCFLWRKIIGGLPHMRCVAPDLLGFGLSDPLPKLEDHSVGRHADSLAELLTALELPSFVLVGQDWGGPLAAAAAKRLVARVSAPIDEALLLETAELIAALRVSPEGQEGLTAFLEKRDPKWIGR